MNIQDMLTVILRELGNVNDEWSVRGIDELCKIYMVHLNAHRMGSELA